MTLGRLLLAEVRLHLYRQRRYAFEFISSSIILLLVFAALVHGMEKLPDTIGLPGTESMALGFVLWSFANAAYGGIAGEVSEEIRGRTLEQLCIVDKTLATVLICRCALQVSGALFGSLVLLYLAFWIIGRPVDIAPVPLLLILALAAPALIGVGLLVSGFSIVFKQVDALSALMLLLVIALVGLPAYPFNALALLPFSYASSWLIAAGDRLALSEHLLSLGIVAANSALWLGVGLFAFSHGHGLALRRGTIGHA